MLSHNLQGEPLWSAGAHRASPVLFAYWAFVRQVCVDQTETTYGKNKD